MQLLPNQGAHRRHLRLGCRHRRRLGTLRRRRPSPRLGHGQPDDQTFDQLGVPPWIARAGSELRASGETARKRNPSTRDQLTQELQIARLVSTGKTNVEVARPAVTEPADDRLPAAQPRADRDGSSPGTGGARTASYCATSRSWRVSPIASVHRAVRGGGRSRRRDTCLWCQRRPGALGPELVPTPPPTILGSD